MIELPTAGLVITMIIGTVFFLNCFVETFLPAKEIPPKSSWTSDACEVFSYQGKRSLLRHNHCWYNSRYQRWKKNGKELVLVEDFRYHHHYNWIWQRPDVTITKIDLMTPK